ncbi:MAG: hypothetical protein WB709_07740 [Solirubrobacteraceae bacterium]
MEPVTLSVIAAALVAKVLNRAENEAVDEAGSALGRLTQAVRERLSKGNQEDQAAFAGVEAAPDSAKQVTRLTEALERSIADEAFRGELQRLVDEAKAGGVDVESIVQNAVGIGIVQIGSVSGSSISVKTSSPASARTS